MFNELSFVGSPLLRHCGKGSTIFHNDILLNVTDPNILWKSVPRKRIFHKVPNVPPLRFPEFIGEWEKFGFADHLERLENGANYDTNATEGLPMSRIETIASYNINYDKVGHCNSRNIEHYKMKYGDILFSHINSMSHIGKTAYYYAEQPLYHGMNLLLIRCKDNLNSLFFYYLLNTPLFLRYCQIYAKQAVNQASISTSDIKRIKLSLPTLHEQNKIASFISVIDQRIATQNKIIQHLESLIKGISQYLFGMVSSKFIPLSQLCNIQKGQQVNSEELTESGKYYMMNGGIIPSGYYDKYNTESNTISISEGGNSCGYVQYNDCRFWSGGHCYTITDIKSNISTLYLFHYLKFKEQDIMALRIGSGLPNIQKKDIAKFPVLVLPEKQQEQITNLLQSITTKIKVEKDCLANLSQQKQYLLQQMFI